MRDLLTRATKTFLQAFTAVLMASGTGFIRVDVAKTAALAGLAAVVSLVNNLVTSSEITTLAKIRNGAGH